MSLPAELWQLIDLQTLHLDYCDQLASLPADIGQLTALQTLTLYKCIQLVSLPTAIGQLAALQNLVIDDSLRNSLAPELLAVLTRNKVALTNHPFRFKSIPYPWDGV